MEQRLNRIYKKYVNDKDFHGNDGFGAYSFKETIVTAKKHAHYSTNKIYFGGNICKYEVAINPVFIINSDIEKQFKELATKWKRETGLYSTFAQKVNDSYLEVIHDGKKYLPYILKELEKGGSVYWHTALKIITKYNPFPNNDLSDTSKVKEAWIAWGKKNHII